MQVQWMLRLWSRLKGQMKSVSGFTSRRTTCSGCEETAHCNPDGVCANCMAKISAIIAVKPVDEQAALLTQSGIPVNVSDANPPTDPAVYCHSRHGRSGVGPHRGHQGPIG